MALEPIEIGDDEDIIRAYFRLPSQKALFASLLDNDFARLMERHSGISLWRVSAGFATKEFVKDKVKRKGWLTGLASCKGKDLKAFGLTFLANPSALSHISVRCPECNLSPQQITQPLCKIDDGTDCPLNQLSETRLYAEIADVFTVDDPVVIVV